MTRSRRMIAGTVVVLFLFVSGMLVAFAQTASFSNTTAIVMAGTNDTTPWPSTIDVSGMSGTIADVDVTLMNLSHTFIPDIDVLLIGPSGESVILMSDAGLEASSTDITLTFDDDAENPLPHQLTSGTYQPTNYEFGFPYGFSTDEYLPAPPTGSYGVLLSEFNGTSPNGTWSLYVIDDSPGDVGQVAGGWSLEITTDAPEIIVPDDISVPNDPGQAGAIVTYTATATDVEDGALTPSCSQDSGTFFPLGTTTVMCSVSDSDDNQVSDSFTITVNDAEAPILTVQDITVPATSPSGAIVTYLPTATDNSGQPVDIACTPLSGTLFAVGATPVTCEMDDAAGNSASDTFTITVLGTSDLLAQLRAETIVRVDNPFYERWMTQMLDVSRFALERGRPEVARLYLRIYDVQLTLGTTIRQISPADAAELRLLLNQARDAMS